MPTEKSGKSTRMYLYWSIALGLLMALLVCLLVFLGPRHRQAPALRIPELSAQERMRAGLPRPGELVLATPADMAYATGVGDDVRDALHGFLRPKNVKWKIVAARPVGDHLLLWISFPEIRDGGIDLIYSKKSNTIIGGFLGGYRG